MEEKPLNLNMSGPSLVTEPEPNKTGVLCVQCGTRGLMRGHCEALHVVWLGSVGCVV